jgi:hypothetical protein
VGAQLENGEETVVTNDVHVAVRERHVPLWVGGGGGRRRAQDATGVVYLRAVEAERDGDVNGRSNVFSADGRTSVAEARRFYLTVERVIVIFVIEVQSLLSRVPGWRERGGTGSGRKASEGPACGKAVGEAGDGIGEVSDAVVSVDGGKVAGEAGGDWRGNGREEELLVLGGLHVGIRADGLGAEPPHHGLDGRVARVKG